MQVKSIEDYREQRAYAERQAREAANGFEPISNRIAELALFAHVFATQTIGAFVDMLPSADYFGTPMHRHVYACALQLHTEAKAVAVDVVFSRLQAQNINEHELRFCMRDIAEEMALYDGTPPGDVRLIAEALRNTWARRELATMAAEADASAHGSNPTADAMAMLDAASSRLEAIKSALADGGVNVTIVDAARELFLSYQTKTEAGPKSNIPTLDACIGSFAPRKTSVIAARTSVGKSILAQEITLAAARQGFGVFYVSLEMDRKALMARLLANMASVSATISSGKRNADRAEYAMLIDAATKLPAMPIAMHASQDATMAIIAEKARHEAAKLARGGKRLGVVVIDHIGLVGTAANGKTPRHELVASVSREARLIADRLNCHVILLAQCNREAEKARGKGGESLAPLMHQISESDRIAQDADNVIMLHAARDPRGQWLPGPSDLIVAKARDGEIGRCHIRIERELQRIREVDGHGFVVDAVAS